MKLFSEPAARFQMNGIIITKIVHLLREDSSLIEISIRKFPVLTDLAVALIWRGVKLVSDLAISIERAFDFLWPQNLPLELWVTRWSRALCIVPTVLMISNHFNG